MDRSPRATPPGGDGRGYFWPRLADESMDQSRIQTAAAPELGASIKLAWVALLLQDASTELDVRRPINAYDKVGQN